MKKDPQLRNVVTVLRALTKKQRDLIDKSMHKMLSFVNLALIIIPLSSGLNAGISLTFLKGATIAFQE